MSSYAYFAGYYDELTRNVDYGKQADYLEALCHRLGHGLDLRNSAKVFKKIIAFIYCFQLKDRAEQKIHALFSQFGIHQKASFCGLVQ